MARVERDVPIGNVRVVDKVPIHRRTFLLALFIERGGKVLPIKVQKMPGGWFQVKNGRHRYVAHKLLGLDTIRVTYGKIKKESQPPKGAAPSSEGRGAQGQE